MSYVFVLDTNKRQLPPVRAGWARKLLSCGRAAVYRRYPFTIILKAPVTSADSQMFRLKIDPGSRTTGLAILNDATDAVVFAGEFVHRGHTIKKALEKRRASRQSRRRRKTRYRKPRFRNRHRPAGWLPPSLESRLANMLTWVRRLIRYCPITAISLELVKFDAQVMQNPEIGGAEYQQGSLLGYEIREYLLEKWQHRCAYCGNQHVPLQVEHIVPRSHGGSNRPNNLTLACHRCNQAKGEQDIRTFLQKKTDLLEHILAQMKIPLKDAAAVNSIRWALFERLKAFSLPVETGSGGRTKSNRTARGLPRVHWIDAACVGASTPAHLKTGEVKPLLIKARGHGNRQMCQTDKNGFPKRHRSRTKQYFGFRTGDVVRAVVPEGKHAGTHVGRITIRSRPLFQLNAFEVHPRYLQILQKEDGYEYV
jgi:5-methylcytosine-specific restriction endonuclease McrA